MGVKVVEWTRKDREKERDGEHPPILPSTNPSLEITLVVVCFFCPCLPHLRQRQLQLRELLLQRHEGGRRRAAQRRLRLALITTLPLIPLLLGRLLAAPPRLVVGGGRSGRRRLRGQRLDQGRERVPSVLLQQSEQRVRARLGGHGPAALPQQDAWPQGDDLELRAQRRALVQRPQHALDEGQARPTGATPPAHAAGQLGVSDGGVGLAAIVVAAAAAGAVQQIEAQVVVPLPQQVPL